MSVSRKSKLKTVILRQQTNINLRTKPLVNSNCMMFLFVYLFVFKGSSDSLQHTEPVLLGRSESSIGPSGPGVCLI